MLSMPHSRGDVKPARGVSVEYPEVDEVNEVDGRDNGAGRTQLVNGADPHIPPPELPEQQPWKALSDLKLRANGVSPSADSKEWDDPPSHDLSHKDPPQFKAIAADGELPTVSRSLLAQKQKAEEPRQLDTGPYTCPVAWQDQPLPVREWLVPNWIPMGEVTLLYGDGGVGKSLLALQLQVALACRSRWLNQPIKPVPSTGIYCEDDLDELHMRIADICRLLGCQMSDLGDMQIKSRVGMDNLLMNLVWQKNNSDGSRAVLEETLLLKLFEREAKAAGSKLWIFDTAADGFGGNQNDPHMVRQFIHRCKQFAKHIGGAVLLLAHPSVAGMSDGRGYSGTVQWNAAARSRMYMEEPQSNGHPADPYARVLTRMKANYARRDETIELRWQNGAYATVGGSIDDGPKPDCKTVFLRLLKEMYDERQWASHNSRAGNYAPRLFATRPRVDREDYLAADFVVAMQALFRDRTIKIEEYRDPHGSKHERIIESVPDDACDKHDF
jgi:RecA-family ATPase